MGVRATMTEEWTEPPMFLKDHLWYGPPGLMIRTSGVAGFLICCPRCGQVGSARDGAKWTASEGSVDDVTTLSLQPSILKSCCGWHGYLRRGMFEEC